MQERKGQSKRIHVKYTDCPSKNVGNATSPAPFAASKRSVLLAWQCSPSPSRRRLPPPTSDVSSLPPPPSRDSPPA
eukprot:1774307-Pleurochrysis_carterae.AAC.1